MDLAIDPVDVSALGIPEGRSSPPSQYLDLDTIRNADDLMSVISQRRSNGVITVAFFKVFVRDKREERTSFVASELEQAFKELVDITFERIAEIKTNPSLLRELQLAAGGEIIPEGGERRGTRR